MTEERYRYTRESPSGRPVGLKSTEGDVMASVECTTPPKKQSYLTKYDRFTIAKFHIDGVGIGILLTVWAINVLKSGIWLVSAFSFIIMGVIALGAIKKGKYLDTLVEPGECDS